MDDPRNHNRNFGRLITNNPSINPNPNPNQPIPLQNVLGCFFNGIGGLNINSSAVSHLNPSRQQGQGQVQLLARNSVNLASYSHQNVGLHSGQFFLQNACQNLSPFIQMQNTSYSPFVSGGFSMFGNHVTDNVGLINPNFHVNQQSALANFNGHLQQLVHEEQQRFISQVVDVSASNQSPNTGQQSQGSLHVSGGLVPAARNFQENHGNDHAKWLNSQCRSFTGHKKEDALQKRFNSQFRHMKHVKGKFGIHDDYGSNGYNNDAAESSGLSPSMNQNHVKKKLFSLNYSGQEVQQWREDRKKHYPSRANMEKRLKERRTMPEVANQDAKLRCQQLKEILAKQAQLGCEVADIPLSYLSDSEKQSHGWKEGGSSKNDMFRNKPRKRGRSHLVGGFAKKERSGDHHYSKTSDETGDFTNKQRAVSTNSTAGHKIIKMESSLLQKLLERDIRRDKSYLLQVFRFVSVNSFFAGWPDKPLRFTSVVVKESAAEGKVVEGTT